MKFEGSLTHFFPPDLLILVANLGKEGVLTVTGDDVVLTVTVKDGFITDAQSDTADRKTLKSLLVNRLVNSQNYATLVRAQEETRMPVRQILDRLGLMANDTVRECYINAMKEAVFEFFSLDRGFFRFTEVEAGMPDDGLRLNPQATAMEIAQWTDEVKDMEREISSLERGVSLTPEPGPLSGPQAILVRDIKSNSTVRDLVRQSPFSTHATLKTIKQLVDKRTLVLHAPGAKPVKARQAGEHQGDTLFLPFKAASRQILTGKTLNDRMKGVLTFCKAAFDHFFIVSMNTREVVHLLHFYRDANRALKRSHLKNLALPGPPEPLFSRILETRTAFFGSYFDAGIIEAMARIPEKTQCAVIPYRKHLDTVSFLYIVTGPFSSEASPFKYLEILSWMLNPETGFNTLGEAASGDSVSGAGGEAKDENHSGAVPRPDKGGAQGGSRATGKPAGPSSALADIAATVDELPAMPHVTTTILNLLSDPDFDQENLVAVISQDQSIMMTLIKIANSVLYRGVTEISTVREAVNRLGIKAIKSIVIASATRTLFPKGELEFNRLSHPLWKHSKECGIVSRRLAMELGYGDPEEAFVGGLLHDMGKLAILMKDIQGFKAVLKLEEKQQGPGVEAELEVLGYTHTQVGALLMQKWHMPEPLRQCVDRHHSPGLDTGLTGMVALGDYYAHVLGRGRNPEEVSKPKPISDLLEQLEIDGDAESRLMEKIRADMDQASLFD